MECWARLRESSVGRLAVVVDGEPDIFPVNFVTDHGSVVLRTAAGTKLAGAVGRQVAFEADGYDADQGTAWSVVLKGRASEVNRLHDVVAALDLPLVTWHAGPKPRFVRIEPDRTTGVCFPVSPAAQVATEPAVSTDPDPG